MWISGILPRQVHCFWLCTAVGNLPLSVNTTLWLQPSEHQIHMHLCALISTQIQNVYLKILSRRAHTSAARFRWLIQWPFIFLVIFIFLCNSIYLLLFAYATCLWNWEIKASSCNRKSNSVRKSCVRSQETAAKCIITLFTLKKSRKEAWARNSKQRLLKISSSFFLPSIHKCFVSFLQSNFSKTFRNWSGIPYLSVALIPQIGNRLSISQFFNFLSFTNS